MTKEETDLIGEAIDFYNLNHFKGKETKKQLVKLKKRIKALTIRIVSNRRELLNSFIEWATENKVVEQHGTNKEIVDNYLKTIL